MPELIIKPLNLGEITRDKSQFTYFRDIGTKITAPIIAWYIEGAKEKILVDTGGTSVAECQHPPYSRTKEQELDRALLKIGVDPGEIAIVILTHLHWDHAANNHLFPNARFIVQRQELQYAAAPLPVHSYDLQLISKTKYEIIEGDQNITEGVSVILTPGHSMGMQSVVVNTAKGKYVIAGDAIPLNECWRANPPIPNAVHVDLRDCYASFEKIKNIADYILPGHDPEVFNKVQYP